MTRVIYVIGIPGSGKTTMVERALDRIPLTGHTEFDPFGYTDYGWLIHLGRRGTVFGGTDGLSMSVQPRAIEWIKTVTCDVVIGEGDRLANAGFLDACPNLTLVYLDTPLTLARERSDQRAARTGRDTQSSKWWRGRVTKVDNLIGRRAHVRYDGTAPKDELSARLAALIGNELSQLAK